MTNKIIYYTKAMQNGEKNIVLNMIYFDAKGNKCKLLGTVNNYLIGKIKEKEYRANKIELSYCLKILCKPINIKEAELIKEFTKCLYKANYTGNWPEAEALATYLIANSEFNITKK